MSNRRHDPTGRTTGQLRGRQRRDNGPPDDERGWVWLTRDMLESPAWRALSENARRVIDRVMIEHMAHAGVENGRLPVTYADLVAFGLRRNSIAPAIAEAVALGWLEHQRGRKATGDAQGHAQTFRLTWLRDSDNEPATNRWKAIKTTEQARQIAVAARSVGVDARSNANRPTGKI